ncbi:MAG: ubiquinone biosynthesis regulatory protein kinase UbiB [Pseudomonadales bacterium]|nr:ubiquinone biosynthesis regulatory protein kinase UbiB [Pseudomonadales bacterium]
MRLIRMLKIAYVLITHRLDRLIPANALPLWARILILPFGLLPPYQSNPGQSDHSPAKNAASLRLALEQLGPIFIKFGQILSTRRDLFDPDTADELQKLQDRVPPFPSVEARKLIEASLGQPIDSLFNDFEDIPLASASVAQVHSARLKTGEQIVIKIIRPGIDKIIRDDLKIMHLLARLVLWLWADAARLHPLQIVADYERTILDELDLQLEAANTNQLRDNWLDSNQLYVPEVYWDYCSTNVMVMERIYGLTAGDIKGMVEQQVDMQKLAHLGVEIFFSQVFNDNFFHADMHPGNVFIDVSNPAEPTYIALDCAIIGSLTEADKNYLAKNLLAFFHRDYLKVAQLHVECGWVPAATDIREFETVIRSVCDPIFQKPIKDISFGKVLLALFQTARRFDMEIQPQLVLLQKTLLNIEGMGRQIYPDLDLWQTAAPFIEKWMQSQMGMGSIFKRIKNNLPNWVEQFPEVPQLAFDALSQINKLGQSNSQQLQLLAQLQAELAQQRRQRNFSRLGGIALIAALLLPLSGMSEQNNSVVGASLLGSLGIYWMFIKP